MRLHLHPAAYDEAIEAATWYDDREGGLGEKFLDAVDRAIETIQQNPTTGSSLETLDDPAVRRVPISRFPYMVIFEVFADEVHVLAIAHARRKPNYWLNRRDGDSHQ